MNESDDTNSFFDEMLGVRKLKQDKILSQTNISQAQQSLDYRRKAAQQQNSKYQNFLTDGEIESVEPQEILSYKTSGIQPNVFKNLKKASYAFDYHLDLHRMSLSQARQMVYKLVSSAEVEDFRCLLITHGKGERSQQPAKLKSYVNHWLRQIEQVIAFHSALPKHGGAGSVYVLLKKPKENRKINQIKYE
jgi:DNA-nicking Smr family endonuclease